MKKLLFATALVASAAAFADPTTFNWIGFEGYSAGGTFSNGTAEKGEDGNDKTPGPFFYYDGDQDGSSVKAFGGENAAAPSITRPAYFGTTTPNANYLDLSTEGGVLWRSINPISDTEVEGVRTYGLGTAQAVAADGTYFDTLVQFTPTEDGGTPELESADKLAIWLNVDSNQQTNLQVRANLYDFGEAPSATATTFTLAPETGTKEIVAGQWYRLTVKATPNVMNTDENGIIPVFEIYIDGVQMCATTAQFTSGMVTTLTGMNALSEDAAAAIAANKLFPSLAEMGNQGDTPTLTGVGFKGSGALDDIVWTTEDPFAGGSGGDDAWIATVTEIFDGANLDAAEKAKITAWASGNSIVVDTTVEGQAEIAAAAYLLGLDELPDAIPELTITAIEEGEDANDNPAWILTVAASVTTSGTTTDLELPTTINGAITLTQAGTLAGLATATPTTTGFTATVDETVTVTVPKTQAAAAFMKVGVGIAPAANNAQQE